MTFVGLIYLSFVGFIYFSFVFLPNQIWYHISRKHLIHVQTLVYGTAVCGTHLLRARTQTDRRKRLLPSKDPEVD